MSNQSNPAYNINSQYISKVSMTNKEFHLFSSYIESKLGIKMPDKKKIMLESRLQKRLRILHITSFRNYYNYIFSPTGQKNEIYHMINSVTTNETSFFREPNHFAHLKEKIIPALNSRSPFGNDSGRIKIWSAGCSSGEEPYSISITLKELTDIHPRLSYEITATDISTKVLKAAAAGIYPEDSTHNVPADILKKYFLKSRNQNKKLFKLSNEIRSCIKFKRLNFMDNIYNMSDNIDIVFCRNVLIYFDQQTRERIFRKFHSHLKTGGYLFIGHSETMNGMGLPFKPVQPTIYQKD